MVGAIPGGTSSQLGFSVFAELFLDLIDFVICTKIFVSSFDRRTRPVRIFNFFSRDHVVHNDCPDLSLLNPQVDPVTFSTESDLNILTVARLSSQKNFVTLLDALKLRPHYHLFIAGNGPEFSHISRLALTMGLNKQITFLGEICVSDLVYYYKHCDIFVLSSFWEGFPISTLEAMSLSKPVVVSDVGGCSEIFEFNPSLPFGFLVPSINPLPHLLAALDSYALSERLLLDHSRNSRTVYDDFFSCNQNLSRLADIVTST